MDEQRRDFLEERLNNLPGGCVTKRTINGKCYYYYQWVESGKQYSKVISEEKAVELKAQILERRSLKKELSQTSSTVCKSYEPTIELKPRYLTNVLTGNDIMPLLVKIKDMTQRDVCKKVEEYLCEPNTDKLLIIYGLKGSGKSTIIKSAISNLNSTDLAKTAYIQLSNRDSMEMLESDLETLVSNGFNYFFIDEITLLNGFSDKAYVLYNEYSSKGYKLILSGTDSLSFVINNDKNFIDRCIICKTSYIPFKEAKNIFGVNNLHDFVTEFKKESVDSDFLKSQLLSHENNCLDYFSTAVISNMEKALDYDANELSNEVNKVIDEYNSKLALDVLSACFGKDESIKPETLKRLNEALLFKSKESTINILESRKIKETLSIMDFISDVDVVNLSDLNRKISRTVFTQVSIRYYSVLKMVKDILLGERFKGVSIVERNALMNLFEKSVLDKLVEDVVLYESKLFRVDSDVFTLVFADGKFDMVIFNTHTNKCSIYKIVNSDELSPIVFKDFNDQKKCFDTQFRFGTIEAKYILYLGENKNISGIECLNITDYLNDISLSMDEKRILAEFKKVLNKLIKK